MPMHQDANPGGPSGEAFEAGHGPTLVLLHGLTGTWHIWKPVLDRLAERHRVLAVTLPGHFGGPALAEGCEPTVDALADALIADLRSRGIERAHFAGNSLGGWLSLEMARRGVALSVTALSPAGAWRTKEDYVAISKPFRIVYALMPLVIVLTTLFVGFAWIRRVLNKQTMEHGDRMSPSEFRNGMRGVAKTSILPKLLVSMGRDGPIKPMQVPPIPVHIAWSGEDKVIPFPRYGEPMMAFMQGAAGSKIPGVGHVPMYDDPEHVAAVITATVARAEQASEAAA